MIIRIFRRMTTQKVCKSQDFDYIGVRTYKNFFNPYAMSAKNIDMSKIKQVMRMMLQRNGGTRPSNLEIGRTLGLYKGTVNDYVHRIESDPLSIEELLEMDDPVLERRQPEVNKVFEDFCNHYGMVHTPLRQEPTDQGTRHLLRTMCDCSTTVYTLYCGIVSSSHWMNSTKS